MKAARSFVQLAIVALAACGSVGESNSGENDPTITSVSPDHGPTTGGITVTLEGTGFSAGDPFVVVGGVLANNAVATSDSQLTFELPPGIENELVDVTVGNGNGFGSKLAAFRYNPRPIILSVTPEVGRSAGGTQITITGRGFQQLEAGVPTIRIGGGVASDVQIVDDKTMTATTGAVNGEIKPFTKVDVEIQNANGTVVMPEAFTITARGLLALARGNSRVHFIDKVTGEVTQLARVTHRISSCTTKDGILYGSGRGADGTHELVTFDPISGAETVVGKLREANMTQHALGAISFVGTKLVGIDNSPRGPRTNRLMEIDPATGTVTFIGATAMALQPAAGITQRDATTLYYADRSNANLGTINANNSTLAPGPAFSGGSTSTVHSLTNLDGTLYLTERDTSRLFTVNPATAALTLLANLSFPPSAMCETPSTF